MQHFFLATTLLVLGLWIVGVHHGALLRWAGLRRGTCTCMTAGVARRERAGWLTACTHPACAKERRARAAASLRGGL